MIVGIFTIKHVDGQSHNINCIIDQTFFQYIYYSNWYFI